MVDQVPAAKTAGEQAFEAYLESVELGFAFEEEVDGTTRRPDYRIDLEGEPARFEVKQFDPEPGDFRTGVGIFSPYPDLREKINAARLKFKGLKGTAACSLVLYNNGKPLVFLGPAPVYGAMLGEVGLTFPFDPQTGAGDVSQMKPAFLGGGKMIRYTKGGKEAIAPQNTTISAIVVISAISIGQRRFGVAKALRERDLQRGLSDDEFWEMAEDWEQRSALSEAVFRVRVYENPYAVKPLSRRFGTGRWDERFGPDGDRLVRLYVGPDLVKLEDEERAAGIKVEPWGWT